MVGQRHKAAAAAFLERHRRSNGYAQAGTDHAEDAAELATLKNTPGLKVRPKVGWRYSFRAEGVEALARGG